MAANVLWQLTETGLRAFIVLYLTRGLHKSFAFSALAMGVVAVAALIAAPIAGKLADRYGTVRVLRPMLLLFGLGLLAPSVIRSTGWLLAVLPIVGLGGAMALSLPYAILMRIMPSQSHGATAGLFDLSTGAGSLLGPLVTGAAIDAFHSLFRATAGYAAMWPVLAISTLISIPFMRRRDLSTEAAPG
jgi:MFS family permease